jgi:hypothetical protein
MAAVAAAAAVAVAVAEGCAHLAVARAVDKVHQRVDDILVELAAHLARVEVGVFDEVVRVQHRLDLFAREQTRAIRVDELQRGTHLQRTRGAQTL